MQVGPCRDFSFVTSPQIENLTMKRSLCIYSPILEHSVCLQYSHYYACREKMYVKARQKAICRPDILYQPRKVCAIKKVRFVGSKVIAKK